MPTITTHVWSADVSRPWESPPEFPVVVEPGRLFTANAQEVEGGPGAVILLARDLPLPFTGYELHPPAVTFTREVHEKGGYVEGDRSSTSSSSTATTSSPATWTWTSRPGRTGRSSSASGAGAASRRG